MDIIYIRRAKEDIAYWQRQNIKVFDRINALIKDIQNHPFKGIGKPEPLRFDKSDYWSRRIDLEHRLIYKVHDRCVYIAQSRFHY